MKAVSSLSQGQARRTTLTILPLALLLTAMGGFALRPELSMEEARAMRSFSEGRVAECEAERDAIEGFTERGGYERLSSAIERARHLVPVGTTELELHSVVRIAARSCEFELASMSIHEPRDPGFARLDDFVVMRTVDMRGKGSLASLPRLVSALRSLGYPTSVLEFTAARAGAGSHEFRWQAVLGVFASTDLPTPEEGGSGEGAFPDEGGLQ